jgi:hypothetical protein
MDRTHDGKVIRMLTSSMMHTRQCLAICVESKLNSEIVLGVLNKLFLRHGPPEHIRSGNGAEFTVVAV